MQTCAFRGVFYFYPSMRPSIGGVLAFPLDLIIAPCPEYLQAPYLGSRIAVPPAPTFAQPLAGATRGGRGGGYRGNDLHPPRHLEATPALTFRQKCAKISGPEVEGRMGIRGWSVVVGNPPDTIFQNSTASSASINQPSDFFAENSRGIRLSLATPRPSRIGQLHLEPSAFCSVLSFDR